jgi:hypothetical protein
MQIARQTDPHVDLVCEETEIGLASLSWKAIEAAKLVFFHSGTLLLCRH